MANPSASPTKIETLQTILHKEDLSMCKMTYLEQEYKES